MGNRAPMASDISNRSYTIGSQQTQEIDLRLYFRDPDTGDRLTFSAVSSNTNVVRVSISRGVGLTMTPGSVVGTSTITVTARDRAGLTAEGFFYYAIRAVGAGTDTVGTPPNRTVAPSSAAFTVNMARYFFGATAFWRATSTNTSIARVSRINHILTVTPGSGLGTSTIRFWNTADATAVQSFTVTTGTPNPRPRIAEGGIPPQSGPSGIAQTLNLDTYFVDTDALTYAAVSANTAIAAVSVSGSTLTITPGSTLGSTTLTLTATDTANQSLDWDVTFTTFSATNAPRTVGTIPNRTAEANSIAQTVDLSDFFTDDPGDRLTYSATSSSPTTVAVSVSESTLTMRPLGTGTATITAIATDRTSLTAPQVFTFTTTAPAAGNAPAAVGTIPNRIITTGGGRATQDLPLYFRARDALTYTAQSSTTGVATVAIEAATGVLTATGGATVGTTTITVTATAGAQSATQTFTVTTKAYDPAGPPITLDPLPAAAGQLYGPSTRLGLAPYFHGASRYSAVSDHRTIAVADVVGGTTLVITPTLEQHSGMVGTATITVTAFNAFGSVAQTLMFTVGRGTRPTITTPIPDQAVDYGAADTTITLSNHFADADPGDVLTYTPASLNAQVAQVSVANGVLTIAWGATPGRAEIRVIAQDRSFNAVTDSFFVTLREPPGGVPPNTPPAVQTQIPSRTLQVGQVVPALDVAPFFQDTDALTYTAVSHSPTQVAVAITGSMLTITPLRTGLVECNVTATDTAGQTAVSIFHITVQTEAPPAAQPAHVGAIPRHNALPGGADQTLDVAPYFSDILPLTYTADADNDDLVTLAISGSTLTMTPGDTLGSTQISVTATNTANLTNVQQFEFVVFAQAPVRVGTIPTQTITHGGNPLSFSVAPFFSSSVALTYTVAGSARASIVASSGLLTLTPLAAGSGLTTDTVTVTATDLFRQSATQTFSLRQTDAPIAANPPPTRTGTIPNRFALVNGAAQTLNVAAFFTDTDALTYTARSSDTDVVTTSVSGAVVTLTPADDDGTATVTITATDTASQQAQQAFTFTTADTAPTVPTRPPTVTNPPPTRVGTPSDQDVETGAAATEIAMATFFADTDTLTYSVATSSATIASVAINGVTGVLTLNPTRTAGTATITVTATDTANQSITQMFTLTVTAPVGPNTPPRTVGQPPDRNYRVTSDAQSFDVARYFTDTDTLTYFATSSDTNVVQVRMEGTFVVMHSFRLGTAIVTLGAVDTANQRASVQFRLTVTAQENPAPLTVGTIPNRTLQINSAAQSFNIADYFADNVGDGLTFDAVSSNLNVCRVRVGATDGALTVTPGATVGIALITVTATDTAGQTAAQRFQVTTQTGSTAAPPPEIVGSLMFPELVVGQRYPFQIAGLFRSTLPLTYSVGGGNANVLRVDRDPSYGSRTMPALDAFDFRGVAPGTSNQVISATDTLNQTAQIRSTVTVVAAPAVPAAVAAPMVRRPFANARLVIHQQMVFQGTYYFSIPVYGGVFRAVSSDPSVVSVFKYQEQTFWIQGLKAGTSNIRVTARNRPGAPAATATFVVTVLDATFPGSDGVIPTLEFLYTTP